MAERFDVAVVGLGALGSATCWQLARQGVRVLGLERFALGHVRGASHDTTRILRRSYHTPGYVRLAGEAYDDWADLEADAGTTLVTVTGGIDLYPPSAAIPAADYRAAMAAAGVAFTEMDDGEIAGRWPRFTLPAGTTGLYQADAAIVPAARSTAVLQQRAQWHGAVLRDRCPVHAVHETGGGVDVVTAAGTVRCDTVVLCTDAWTNDLLAPLAAALPLTVTREQVTYLAVARPDDFAPGRLPIWIWMDDPSFYGFPTYGEAAVKVAQDCGGAPADPDRRSFAPDAGNLDRVTGFAHRTLRGTGRPLRTVTCLYTLTPDRDFALGSPPGHDAVVVGLGAGHGFKFAPTIGRLLAGIVAGRRDDPRLAAFTLDRPALTDPAYAPHWLV